MHIGVLSYYYLPIINGVTISIADWKRWGEKAGNRFTTFVPQLGNVHGKDASVVSYPAVSLYRRFGITMPLFPDRYVEKAVRRLRPDVLHVHHPYFIGALALRMKKMFGIPVVFTYHTRYADYARTYIPFLSSFIIRRLVTHKIVRFMNSCNAVTVANASLATELRRNGVKVPLFIVPPGVNTSIFSSGNRGATRKRFRFAASDTVLLYVGRLAKEKNVYFLLNAFTHLAKRNPRVRLLLCGNGTEEEHIGMFIRKKHHETRVTLALHETPETIVDVYSAADMFVYASQTETYGRVIVEAMAAGLAIVALKGPSVVDIIADGINGRIVWRRSSKEFAQTIGDLLRDRNDMKRLGVRAREDALTRYDSQVSWRDLSKVYELVSQSTGTSREARR